MALLKNVKPQHRTIAVLFALLMNGMSVSEAQDEIVTCNTNSTLCLTIHREVVTQYTADDKCQRMGQSLVAITDANTQELVDKISQYAALGGNGLWTAGYIGRLTAWQGFDGIEYPFTDSNIQHIFGVLRLNTGQPETVGSSFRAYPVCQRSRNQGTECMRREITDDNYCYRFGSDEPTTWFEAVNICHDSSTGSTLAKAIVNLKGINSTAPSNVHYVWTDAHRMSFVWRKGSDVPMTYSKFDAGGPFKDNQCVYVDSALEYWGVGDCSRRLTGYICEKAGPLSTKNTEQDSTTTSRSGPLIGCIVVTILLVISLILNVLQYTRCGDNNTVFCCCNNYECCNDR